ncbi:hypothetical protein NQ318_021657 [Aromia moschata]|uniref:MRH domain-containing protein n=1 Tax=Aromia moschata TaxID=1265417 RepID=A0AAV8XSV8_9CUCU|nr:hypothetical protein NQ318_021657 [Aromia moschata]
MFSSEEIRTFTDEAPDNQFLFTKVAMIFGIMGACQEIWKEPGTKNKNTTNVIFTITGKSHDICKKNTYINLRPEVCATPSFLQANCEIFKSFRCKFIYRTLFSKNFCNCISRCWWRYYCAKKHGGWKSMTLAEGYIENSIQNKINVSNTMLNSIENRSNEINISLPSSSTVNTYKSRTSNKFYKLYYY